VITLYSYRGSNFHEQLCDAFLLFGGYTLIEDKLWEVLGAVPDTVTNSFCWQVRRATIAGLA
jgi:hypothetical protein